MIVKRRTTKIVNDTYLIMPDNNKKKSTLIWRLRFFTIKEFLGLSPVVIIALTEVFDGTVPSKITFPFP